MPDHLDDEIRELKEALDRAEGKEPSEGPIVDVEFPEVPSTEDIDRRVLLISGKTLEQTVEDRRDEEAAAEKRRASDQEYYRQTGMALSIAYGLLAIPLGFVALAGSLRIYAGLQDPWYGLIILSGILVGGWYTVTRLRKLKQ